MSLEKEFVPPEQALELKELGFDKPCLGRWLVVTKWEQPTGEIKLQLGSKYEKWDKNQCFAPTFSQAFKFFRELPDWPIESWIRPIISEQPRHYRVFIWTKGQIIIGDVYDTYPEAEIGCLNRLIEIVKNRQI